MIEIEGQNKISINKLLIRDGDLPPYQFKYEFIELKEYIPREDGWVRDPVAQYKFVYNRDNIHVGVAKRQSAAFDIYYDGNFIDSPVQKSDGTPTKIAVFEVTYDKIIFEMEYKNRQRVLDHNKKFDSSEKMSGRVLTSNLYFTERIKNSCRLFCGLILIETNVFVAHGRFVSQFYLKNQQFHLRADKHFEFDTYIKFMFKRLEVNPITGYKYFSVGVLLENGEIHVIDSETPSDYQSWELNEEIEAEGVSIPGEVLTCAGDPVQFRCNLFLSVNEDKEEKKKDTKDMDVSSKEILLTESTKDAATGQKES